MAYLQDLLLMLGVILVLVAYGRYVRRTGDWGGVLRFWSRGMALSVVEFKLQRAGIVVLLLAVVLRFCRALFQW